MPAHTRSFRDLIADESGASGVEYGMIAALIVIALLAGLTRVADENDATYDMLEEQIAS